MSEGWTTESVLKKHGLWRELAGPAAGPTAIKLQWQDMQLEKLQAENERLRETLSEIEDFARGEGDVGNIVARKAGAALRPETAPPADQPTGDEHG